MSNYVVTFSAVALLALLLQATAGARTLEAPADLTALQREIAKSDLNRTGKLERAEKRAYLEARVKARADFVKKWDRNGDGQLDESESARARAAWRKALSEKLAAERKNAQSPKNR